MTAQVAADLRAAAEVLPDAWVRAFAHRVAPVAGCLEFQGARMSNGYGKLSYGGTNTTAHRVSWALANQQPVPEGRFVVVRHSCDNPPCVNPGHLTAGTPGENTRDMVSKGRHGAATKPESVLRGDRHPWSGPRDSEDSPSAVLTWGKVADLRARRRDGATYRELMADFGVSKSCVHDVVTGRTWHTPGRTADEVIAALEAAADAAEAGS